MILLLTPPDFLSFYLQRHLHVVREQLSGAEALRHLYVGAVDVGGKLCHGVKTYVAFEGTGHPRADASLGCHAYPFPCSTHSAM